MNIGDSENMEEMTRLISSKDKWVRLWSSLFIIQRDPSSEKIIQKLVDVLDSGDGQSYYPRAIPILLQTENPRFLEISEGILEKSGEDDLFLYVNDNTLRMLILSGSRETLNFLISGLNDKAFDARIISFDEPPRCSTVKLNKLK